MTPVDAERRMLALVDDLLVGRDAHGLDPRLAREVQLAAGAITHERFRKLLQALARRLVEEQTRVG